MTEVTTERPTDRPTRVMIVDDQALVRAGFRMVLDAEPDIDVVARVRRRAGRARRTARPRRRRRAHGHPHAAARRHRGDAPGRRARRPPPKVLVLTTFDLDEYVYAALRAGAAGFLLKDAGAVGAALGDPGRAHRGRRRRARADAAAARPLPARARDPRAAGGVERLDVLTEREREVLEAVGRGLNNTRDRRVVLRRRGHGQDPHRAHPRQARAARPGADGRAGLRDGPRPRRRSLIRAPAQRPTA